MDNIKVTIRPDTIVPSTAVIRVYFDDKEVHMTMYPWELMPTQWKDVVRVLIKPDLKQQGYDVR